MTIELMESNDVIYRLKDNERIGGGEWISIGKVTDNYTIYATISHLMRHGYETPWVISIGARKYRNPTPQEWDDICCSIDDDGEVTSETRDLVMSLRLD